MGSNDEERAMLPADELRRKKRIKCFGYIAAFVIFQIVIFAALGLTVLRVRSPKIKIDTITTERMDFPTGSFNMAWIAEVSVKNKNWGDYKFEDSTMTLSYQGVPVGEAQIPSRKAKARGTRRMNIAVTVSSDQVLSNPNLGSDLNSGILILNGYTKLKGKVTLMHLMKRNKSGEMKCSIIINTTSQTVMGINC